MVTKDDLTVPSGNPESSVYPINPEKLPSTYRKRSKYLAVTMPDKTVLEYPKSYQTFLEAIEQIGIEKVRNLDIKANKMNLISTEKSEKYGQHKTKDGYLVMTQTSTNRKRDIINQIAIKLGVDIIASVKEKGSPGL